MIESDWGLHSSESESNVPLKPSSTQPQPTGKRRRTELDKLKENLTDLMKAPILPVSDGEESEDAEKLREEEKERRRKKREKKRRETAETDGKRNDENGMRKDRGAKKDKVATTKTSNPPNSAGQAAQLPTPSTTHSYASTNDGTPKMDDMLDDEDLVRIHRPRGEGSMITPPPSNRTQSVDEHDSDAVAKQSGTLSQAKNIKIQSPIAEDTSDSGGSDDSSEDEDEEEEETSTLSEEDHKRVYAFRRRKAVHANDQVGLTNRGNARRGATGPANSVAIANGVKVKKGKVCITCKVSELKTKNEITCGRSVLLLSLIGTYF